MLEINKKVVPFFIEQISKTETEWQVKFEDIRNLEEAEEILGLSVFVESNKNKEEDEEFRSYDVLGFQIIDKQLGPIGEVINHIEKPGQDMLEISFNTKSFFIPFVADLMIDFDNDQKIIYTDLPDGLIDINN